MASMEVYEFKKSLLVRQQEAAGVLSARNIPIPAGAVRKEWALYLEVALEPSGWQALWRMPRVVCEELSTRYPAVVMGTVEQVLFDELKAILVVEAVDNDDIHLPEKQLVPLCELWPMKDQRDESLNVDRSADAIDQLRFFFQHVWMPWDNDSNDDQRDWADRHLQSRIRFYCDLRNRTMSKRMTCHILALLGEANHIQQKRELLELEVDDDEELEDESALVQNGRTRDLLKIQLRLNSIKNEIEILEFFAPEMRNIYETVRFSNDSSYPKDKTSGQQLDGEALIVTHIGSLEAQIEYLTEVKKIIAQKKLVRICDSLQDAFDRSKPGDDLYLPPGGHHLVKFFDDFNEGSIRTVTMMGKCDTVIQSRQDDSVLLTVSGDYCFENITLDCSNVQTGVLIKRGKVTFKNCHLTADSKSWSSNGILICANASVCLENCLVENFFTGIYANSGACNVRLLNNTIQNCFDGIKIVDHCSVHFSSSSIVNCRNYGAVLEVDDDCLQGKAPPPPVESFNDCNQLDRPEFDFEGACEFRNNRKANFVVFNGNSNCNGSFFEEEQSEQALTEQYFVR